MLLQDKHAILLTLKVYPRSDGIGRVAAGETYHAHTIDIVESLRWVHSMPVRSRAPIYRPGNRSNAVIGNFSAILVLMYEIVFCSIELAAVSRLETLRDYKDARCQERLFSCHTALNTLVTV